MKESREVMFNLHKGSNHMYLVVLNNIDGDKLYKDILKKQQMNMNMSKKDIADLSLLPFFYSKESKEEIVYKIAKLMAKLNMEKDELSYLKFNLNLYIDKFVKNREILKKIHGEINMMEYLEDMIIEIEARLLNEREEKGIKIGEENNKIEVAKAMIKNNYTKKEILRISKISEEQFNRLQTS